MIHNQATPLTFLEKTIAVLTGISLPLIFIGRTPMGAALIIAVLLYSFLPDRKQCFELVKGLIFTMPGYLIMAVFIAWTPNITASPIPLESLETIGRSLIFLVCAVLVWSAMAHDKRLADLALKSLLVSAVLLILLAVINLTFLPELYGLIHFDGWTITDVKSGFKSSASTAALLIPMVLWVGWRFKGPWQLAALMVTAGFLFIIYQTGSRAAMAGVIGLIVMAGLLITWRQKSWKLTTVMFVCAVASIWAILYWLQSTRGTPTNLPFELYLPHWLVDWHRQEIWQFALSAGEGFRWFGTGINAIDKLSGARDIIPGTNAGVLPFHPHNWMIEVLVETGIIGFTAMITAIAYKTVTMIRDYLHSGDNALLCAILVWAVFWTSSLFNFSYWASWWQVTFVTATAICLAARSDTTHD